MTPKQHYFTPDPEIASRPVVARLRLPGVALDLLTDTGVFAYGQVDRGTELLLRTIPPPPLAGDVLDLGCGYGAIALTLAVRAASARVWAVDVNRRALDLTARNAVAHGLENVTATAPDEVPPDVRFSAVYANPPVRVGKEALHSLLVTWIDRLAGDGAAYLVVHRHLGSDSLAAWLRERGHAVERLRSSGGYRILEVRPAPAETA
jgi:16S rRNA (guanine1207-N2)-methyltransferase